MSNLPYSQQTNSAGSLAGFTDNPNDGLDSASSFSLAQDAAASLLGFNPAAMQHLLQQQQQQQQQRGGGGSNHGANAAQQAASQQQQQQQQQHMHHQQQHAAAAAYHHAFNQSMGLPPAGPAAQGGSGNALGGAGSASTSGLQQLLSGGAGWASDCGSFHSEGHSGFGRLGLGALGLGSGANNASDSLHMPPSPTRGMGGGTAQHAQQQQQQQQQQQMLLPPGLMHDFLSQAAASGGATNQWNQY